MAIQLNVELTTKPEISDADRHIYFVESIGRYRITRQEIITDPQRRAQFAINGYDPDNYVTLHSSANNADEAQQILEAMTAIYDSNNIIFRLVDAGQQTWVVRAMGPNLI
jgi:hypothetical protein